jgi:hypothetical protein
MTITSLDMLVGELPKRCSTTERRECLESLTSVLSTTAAVVSNESPVKLKPSWLGECLGPFLAAVIEDGSPLPSFIGTSIDLFRALVSNPDGPSNHRIDRLLKAHPRLRREMFWRQVGIRAASSTKGFPRQHSDVEFLGRFNLTDADLDWLVDCTSSE